MATARNHHSHSPSASHKEILSIRETLHMMHEKMNKQEQYCPNVQQLDAQAEMILRFIEKHHKEIGNGKNYLKNAIIDLSEVPVLHGKMQRVAIHTCLKVAIDHIDKFCTICY